MGIPPTILRGRIRTTTYLYDDPTDPRRVTGSVQSPEWTDDDRALLVALQMYEDSLCPGCGKPIDQAWHTHTDGWWETRTYACYACSAANPEGEVVKYHITSLGIPLEQAASSMPPFQLGVTTYSPD